MKQVAGSLKLSYSQYRELQAFSQFGSDLDQDTKARLAKGERIVEVLKQEKNSPMTVEHQVVILYAVLHDFLKEIETADVLAFERELMTEMEEAHPEILSSVRETGKLTEENRAALDGVLREFAAEFLKTRG